MSAAASPRTPILIRLLNLAERFSVVTAFVGGGVLTFLAFFITFDVLGRRFGGPYSGATDEIAGYAMCFAMSWALSYTLTVDKHVRVDLIFGSVPLVVRKMLDRIALFLLVVFASLLAVNSYTMAMESFEYNMFSTSTLRLPLGIPQMLMAIGFGLLALQAFVTFIAGILYPSALKRATALERKAPQQFDI